MARAIIGRKVGMTQVFTTDGTLIPVTVVQAGPCVVVNKRTVEQNGYSAVQLGFDKILKEKRVNRPSKGYFKKQGVDAHKVLREFRVSDDSAFEVGQEVNATLFAEGDLVDIQGTSIGKGFQGVMKRFAFGGGPKTHGSHFHREPGSIGMCEFPGETEKGRRMPGRMGGETVTVQKLSVVKVVPETNLILVKGAIPGHNNGIVFIKETVKK